jgi:serine/threonine protein kinase
MTDSRRLVAALADRYRIERELGAGGMATVYLAEDLRHDRKVALKVLRPELAAVIGAERFLKEIKVTANLQHPHILGLIDSGEVDGLLWSIARAGRASSRLSKRNRIQNEQDRKQQQQLSSPSHSARNSNTLGHGFTRSSGCGRRGLSRRQ